MIDRVLSFKRNNGKKQWVMSFENTILPLKITENFEFTIENENR
jgi:hypothetical protein